MKPTDINQIEKLKTDFSCLLDDNPCSKNLRHDTEEYLRAMERHDLPTFCHELRVSLIACQLAKFCGYKDLKPEIYGGANHDVGKLDVNHELLKKAKFGPDDYKMIEGHAVNGANKLHDYYFVSLIAGMHHSDQVHPYGLPQGLIKETKLSEVSKQRLSDAVHNVSLADFFDALNTRKTKNREVASGDMVLAMKKVYPEYCDRIEFLFSDSEVSRIIKDFKIDDIDNDVDI